MEIKISCQNSSHRRVCSVPSKSALQCDVACLSSMPKCGAPPFRAVVSVSQAELWHLSETPCLERRSQGGMQGSVSTGKGCGTWSLSSEAPVTSNPHPPQIQPGASTLKTPFCSCANCACRTAAHPLPSMVIP